MIIEDWGVIMGKPRGYMLNPVHIHRKGHGDKARLILLQGHNRLEAAKTLEWTTIPATVWSNVSDKFVRSFDYRKLHKQEVNHA